MSYVRHGGGQTRAFQWKGRTPQLPACKNPENQAAWNRLKERLDDARNENYERTLLRAIKSLAASKDAISSYKDALALVGVGQHCANIICPPDTGEATVVSKPGRGKKKKAPANDNATSTKDTVAAAAAAAACEPPPPRVTKKKGTTNASDMSNAISAKELAYQTARQDAIDKWSHPIQANARTDHAYGLEWKVLLLVDNREQKSQHILSKCGMSGIPAEERTLPIGDMTWIAQGLRRHTVGGKITKTVEVELLLGTLIERKSTEDLVASFMGTRYMEQRLRLQHSGQPQILFLIEGDINRTVNASFPKDRMQMALMETRAYLDFQIVHTTHMDDTILTLKRFHRRILQRTFPQAFGMYDDALPSFNAEINRQLPATGRRRQRRPTSLVEMVFDTPPTPALNEPRFQTYNELKAKIERDREAGTRTIGAIHAAMLRQVCGMKQVQAIRHHYPTPAYLLRGFDFDDNPKAQAELLKDCALESSTGTASSNRKVGPKIAQEVSIAYCTAPEGMKRKYDRDDSTMLTTTSSSGSDGVLSRRPSTSEEVTNKRLRLDSESSTSSNNSHGNGKGRAPLGTIQPLVASSNFNQAKSAASNSRSSSTKATNKTSSFQYLDLLSSDDDSYKKLAPEHSLRPKENGRAKPKPPPAVATIKPKSADDVVLLHDSSDEEETENNIKPTKRGITTSNNRQTAGNPSSVSDDNRAMGISSTIAATLGRQVPDYSLSPSSVDSDEEEYQKGVAAASTVSGETAEDAIEID